MLSSNESEEILRIDEIIAKSRQIVNDSLELTKRSQERFKTPFVIKELGADIVPNCGSPVDTKIPGQILKQTPLRTPKSPSVDFESKFLSVDIRPSAKGSWGSYDDVPELRSSYDFDRQKLELVRMKSEIVTEIKERRNAEAKIRDLEDELYKAQADNEKKSNSLAAANDEIKSLLLQLQSSEESRTHLQSQLSVIQEEQNRLQRLLEQRDEEVRKLRNTIEAGQREEHDTQQQLDLHREEIARLQDDYEARLLKLQEDYQQQLVYNQELKAKADNRYSLNAKLLLLEEQLHSLKKAEAEDTDQVSLRKLHELETKLKLTNDRYEQLAGQMNSRNSPSHGASSEVSLQKTTKLKPSLSARTPQRKKSVRGKCRVCKEGKKKFCKD